jgi:hypothetical protein
VPAALVPAEAVVSAAAPDVGAPVLAALLPLSSPQLAAMSPAAAITATSHHRLRARTRTVVLLLISSPPTLARHISDLLPPVLSPG